MGSSDVTDTMARGTDTRFTMDYQGEGYPPKWDGGVVPGRRNHTAQTFPWATESRSMEELCIGWSIAQILTDRNITYTELAQHLGISKQRLGQMITTMFAGGKSYERIDKAITEITDARGGIYACIGYSEVDAAKMQKEVDEWLLLA